MTRTKEPNSIAGWFEAIRADYDMTRETRHIRKRIGLAPMGGSADYHFRNENKYYEAIEKARDMDRNDMIVSQMIDRSTTNVIQDGFNLDPQTGDRGLDLELWHRWQAWANDPDECDLAGEKTWHDYEYAAARAMRLDGDCLVYATEGGQLQFFEAHNIQTSSTVNDTVLGVTIDDYRRRLKYYIMIDDPDPMARKHAEQAIDVRDEAGYRQLFHVYNPHRATQTRGVTALAPIFSLAGMFEDINFAKLVQQQVVSCFAIFRQRTLQSQQGIPSTTNYGSSTTETTSTGEIRAIQNVGPGMEVIGAAGETLSGFSPNVPNAEFFSHVRLMLQIMGVNFGLPLCLVLMDGSETNYSGWRGAVDEARKGFRNEQRNLETRLHVPTYQHKVRQWMQEDYALMAAAQLSHVRIFNHKWNKPTWAYIDPVGDAQGDMLKLQNALTSPRRLHGEGGRDWEEVADETIDDNAYAISRAMKAANKINETRSKDQAPVSWRELIPLTMPNGVQLSMQDPSIVAQDAAEGSSAMPMAKPDSKAETKPAPQPAAPATAQPSKPAPADEAPANATPAGLNGAQIQAAQALLEQLAAGVLAADVVYELIVALGVDPAAARRIVDAQANMQPPQPQPQQVPA